MNSDQHGYTAAYALGAMDAGERARFEAHLDGCPECRAELAGFLETTGRIAQSCSQEPPPSLKANLMKAISRTPQDRPFPTSVSARPGKRRMLPRILLVAAALVTAVAIGGFVVEQQQNSELRAERAAVMTVMTSPDAVMHEAHVGNDLHASYVYSAESNKAVLMSALPELGDDKTYQLWTITADGPTSAGLLDSGTDMALMAGMKSVQSVAITVEPEGGSKQPTTTPIVTVPNLRG